MDDFASGGTPSQVSTLVGEEGENFQCNGTLPTILSKASFKLKAIVTSGETDKAKLAKLGSKVLGVGCNATSDKISIDFTVKVSLDGNKVKTVLSNDHLYHASVRAWLTKSNILGIINGIYDPLGATSPITIKLRVEFRNLFGTDSTLGWDDPIQSVEIQNLWIRLIQELISAGKVTFPRATTPSNAIGKPQLIGFFDGSDSAFAAAIYIRWVLKDGNIHVTLMITKGHVTL